jgi:hypothetical protein
VIKPMCDFCGSELNAFGAILFSPPKEHDVKKYHICVDCYNEMIKKVK